MDNNLIEAQGEEKTLKEELLEFIKKWELLAFLLVITVAAIFLRIYNFDFESNDYRVFLTKWYTAIKDAGGFKGIGKVYGDYTPMYMYLMAFMTYLPCSDLVAIKIFSCIGDFLLAFYVGLIVRRLQGGSNTSFCVGYTAALIMPTVFLNSALWAQCDSIFTAFTAMSLYYLIKGKGTQSMIFYGLAFSFKLQAIFFAPVVIIAILKGKIKWWSLGYFAGVYLISGLPAICAGMSVIDAYSAYFIQMTEYSQLAMLAPNLYTWIAKITDENMLSLGNSLVLFAFCAVGAAMLPLYRKQYKIDDDAVWMRMAAFFAAFMPFVLPHMHERYWYMSDIFALILLLAFPKKWFAPIAVILPSLYAVCKYLFNAQVVELGLAAVLMLVGVVVLGVQLFESINQNEMASVKENNSDNA